MLLKDYFKGAERITSHKYSSFSEEGEPVVLRESYIMPQSVKTMALTDTANHITGRSLVYTTVDNKIFQLPQTQFSARRLHADQIKAEPGWFNMPNPEDLDKEVEEDPMELQLKSNKFQVYDPIIPNFDVRCLTYHLPLMNISNMRTFPTKLESTSTVFAYVHDLFLARMRPDNKYDMIDEDFNYSLLFLAIFLLYAINYVFANFLKGETSKKNFLIH